MSGKFVVTLHDKIQVTMPNTFNLTGSLADYKRWAIMAYSKWSITKTVQSATRIITVSNYEKSEIIESLNIAPHKISVTHLAPSAVFTPANSEIKNAWRTEISKKHGVNRSFVLGVGYEERKNIPLVIEVFSKIASSHPDLDLIIVAAEPDCRLTFAQLAAEKDLSHRVTILAQVQPDELAKLYNLAAAFIYPSERESFGLPPLEAMACGTPTIAMDMTSIPEILENGAMLIKGKDVDTWTNAVEQVLSNEDFRKDLISRGLKQAAKLTWQHCAKKTIKVYHSVTEQVYVPAN